MATRSTICGGEAAEPRLMILANARLPEGRLADVEIAAGLIAATARAGDHGGANERIALDGALLLPASVDGHIHLDKTLFGAPRLPHVEGRSVASASRRSAPAPAGRLPVEARASALVRTLSRTARPRSQPCRYRQ